MYKQYWRHIFFKENYVPDFADPRTTRTATARFLGLRVLILPAVRISVSLCVACWQVQVAETDRLIQRNSTECDRGTP